VPQFDPTWFASQLFWLVVCFKLLSLVMSQIIVPRITDVLETRATRIENDLARAESLKTEAETVKAEYEAALAKAKTEAHEVLRAGQAALAEEMAAQQQAFAKDLSAKVGAAEKNIVAARDQALTELTGVAEEVASMAVERLSGAKPDGKAVSGAVAAIRGGEG